MMTVLLLLLAVDGGASVNVTARGKISKTPWQHLMGSVPGKTSAYFDLEDGGQTVVYWKEAPKCAGLIEVTGKELIVRGGSKRPGAPSKGDEFVEHHIDVMLVKCL